MIEYCTVYLDLFSVRLSELYSYTEGPEFALNRKCFEVEFREHGMLSFLKEKQQTINLGWGSLLPDLQLFFVFSFW